MSVPLLDFLTGRAKQALPFLEGFAQKGFTPAQALEALKGLAPTFNRQSMLDVYAALQSRLTPERVLRLAGRTAPIPISLHNPSPADLGSNYQYRVGAFDETGEPIGYVTVSSNIPLAAVQIEATAGLLFGSQGELYLEEGSLPVSAIAIENIYRNTSTTAP